MDAAASSRCKLMNDPPWLAPPSPSQPGGARPPGSQAPIPGGDPRGREASGPSPAPASAGQPPFPGRDQGARGSPGGSGRRRESGDPERGWRPFQGGVGASFPARGREDPAPRGGPPRQRHPQAEPSRTSGPAPGENLPPRPRGAGRCGRRCGLPCE